MRESSVARLPLARATSCFRFRVDSHAPRRAIGNRFRQQSSQSAAKLRSPSPRRWECQIDRVGANGSSRLEQRRTRSPLNDIVVLKVGSSVLRSGADLPRVVSEIYRHVRLGEHVVAVVSAFAGVTDQISVEARRWIAEPHPSALAAALATGEMESATQLVFALERSGVPV